MNVQKKYTSYLHGHIWYTRENEKSKTFVRVYRYFNVPTKIRFENFVRDKDTQTFRFVHLLYIDNTVLPDLSDFLFLFFY